MKAPKILYLIFSSTKESGGGHFYSLKTISESLQDHIDYKILNLGYTHGQILRDLPNCDFIEIHRENFFKNIRKVFRYVSNYNPDVLHAFDFNSLFIARTISIFFKVRVVFTKAGGRNTKGYIPDTDGNVFFSLENFNYYTQNSDTSKISVLIPNRVRAIEPDRNLISSLINEYHLEDKYVLLRISRFNSYYDTTFKQAINLLRKALLSRPNAVLILVGRVQSEGYLMELTGFVNSEKLPVYFITGDEYTKESSRLIATANVVIATGRGVMEACSLNKIVFCPVAKWDYPALLSASTFQPLFSTNFSERGSLDPSGGFDKFDNYTIFGEDFDPKTSTFFEQYFNINNVKDKYLKFYKSDQYTHFRITNYIGHLVRFFK